MSDSGSTFSAADELAGGDPAASPRPSASTIARAGIVVSAAYLVSRLLGYLRVVVIGTTFGAGPELDDFFTAFRIPDLIFQLVAAGAVASALVPIVSGFQATGETPRAWRIVSTIANLMLVGLIVLAAVAWLIAPTIVGLLAPGFDAANLARTTDLTRVMLIGPIFLGLGAVATAALNGSRRFASSAIAPIIYNLAIIGAAVVLGPSMGVEGLAIGVVAGSAGHLLIQLAPLARAGYHWRPTVDLGDSEARHAFVLMAPRALGLGATQLIFVTLTSIASNLGTGAISAYTIAFSLLQIPIGVIGIPFGIVLFPSLAGELALGRTGSYLALISRAMRVLVFVMLPITALGMVLRVQVVELLLGYGKFGTAAVDETAATLLLFLVGLPAHGVIDVLARSFYARKDTATPVVAAVLGVVVTIGLAMALVGALGLPAVGLALSGGTWGEGLLLLAVLKRREPALDLGGVGSVGLRSLIGALVAGGVALGVVAAVGATGIEGGKVAAFIQAVAATLAGGAAYLLVAVLLRIPELDTIVATTRGLVGSRRAAG
ncbi:MAG TPA: murein biosynthesis integral membrane protein MurJ [Candidatus Limnocylindrales bacterium]